MIQIIYNYSSVLITSVLLAAMLVANEVSYLYGRRHRATDDEGTKTQTNAILASILGLLALLLGFTFTMALQRFDSRSERVIEEANAIGTAHLRSQLLAEPAKEKARGLMDEYIELRLRAGKLDLTQATRREKADNAAGRLQEELWSVALQAAELDPTPTTTGYFIQSLNAVIDAYAKRSAVLEKHVPEVVLLLLFAVLIIAVSVLGYAGGLAGERPIIATLAISVLIILVIFIIIDLDRPRRGLIHVDEANMVALSVAPSEH